MVSKCYLCGEHESIDELKPNNDTYGPEIPRLPKQIEADQRKEDFDYFWGIGRYYNSKS